jgi:hypothetical protein
MTKTALIYCGDITVNRALPYVKSLSTLYDPSVSIAVNTLKIQPCAHVVFLDKKTAGKINGQKRHALNNGTLIHCRSNSTHLLDPELRPLTRPFESAQHPNTNANYAYTPLLTGPITLISAINIAILDQCTEAVIIGSSLTHTPHFDAPENIFWSRRMSKAPEKIKKINDCLPALQKYINLCQYTEVQPSNLDLPNITFKQLMTKNF